MKLPPQLHDAQIVLREELLTPSVFECNENVGLWNKNALEN